MVRTLTSDARIDVKAVTMYSHISESVHKYTLTPYFWRATNRSDGDEYDDDDDDDGDGEYDYD